MITPTMLSCNHLRLAELAVPALMLLAIIAGSAGAQDLPGRLPRPRVPISPAQPTEAQHVQVTARADVARVTQGQKFHLAFIFEIEDGWHIYWRNSGASGGPTEIQVNAPPGFVIGRTLYPRPRSFQGEEGVTYGYEDKTVLFVEVTAPAMLPTAQVSFTANINWMECKEVCLLGRATKVVSVMTGAREPLTPGDATSSIDPAIGEFKKRVPKPLKELAGASAQFADGTLTITLPAGDHSTAEFFPVETPGVTYETAAIRKQGDTITIAVPVNVNPNDSLGQPLRILGTAGLGDGQEDPAYDLEIPLQQQQHD